MSKRVKRIRRRYAKTSIKTGKPLKAGRGKLIAQLAEIGKLLEVK